MSELSGRARAWADLCEIDGVEELPVPWPVAAVERLGLHASLRRFYRLRPAVAPPAGGDDPSVILVLYDTDDPDAVARYENAAIWFAAAGVRVPRVYGSSARALIVGDAGDALLADAAGDRALFDHYAHAIEFVHRLQAHGAKTPGPNPDWCLDEARLRRELEFTERHALAGWLGVEPSSARDDAFDRLAAAVGRQPVAMCHRDYHSRNLLVDGQLTVVDFQDAMSGPVFYDVVSLLRDDYREVPSPVAAAALEAFWSGANAGISIDPVAAVPGSPGPLPAGALQGFYLTAAQRSLKALGTFGYQVSVAGHRAYEVYARGTWHHARAALIELGWFDLIEQLSAFDRL